MDIEILGDGKQHRSYLDVIDGHDGIFYGVADANERNKFFSPGQDEFMNVLDPKRLASSRRSLFSRVSVTHCPSFRHIPRCWKTHLASRKIPNYQYVVIGFRQPARCGIGTREDVPLWKLMVAPLGV
jgi:hypothetical protein